MRVLVLSHLYPNGRRSLSCFVHRQVKALAQQGCDVQVLSPVPWVPRHVVRSEKRKRYADVPKTAIIEGIPVNYPRYPTLPSGRAIGLQGYGMALGLWPVLRKIAQEFDVLHAHMVYPDGFAAALICSLSGLRIPTCITAHGSDVRLYGKRAATAYQVRFATHRAEAVVTAHPEIAGLLRKLGRDDAVVIPNGIDLAEFASEEKRAAREELSLPEDAQIVTFVANLNWFKDPAAFVRAMPIVLKALPQVRALVVGNGPLRGELERIVAEMRIEECVSFLGYRQDVPRILAASDVFVATSPIENIWSTTILEAMASRLPCVVTDAGTTGQHLAHGVNAYFVEPRNPASIGNGIVAVLENAALAAEIGERGRRMMEERFDVNQSAERLITLYDGLAHSRR
jgi:teichuronic acid biosynthesis glycosyltransferase TuaC